MEKFSFYTVSDAAIWTLVAFSVDRLIAVSLPLVKYKVCPPRRAIMVCVMILLLAVGKNFHVFWTRGVDGARTCGRPQPYTHFEQQVRPWIALVTVSALPFVVISACNCLIIWALLRAHRKRTVALQLQRSGSVAAGASSRLDDTEEPSAPAQRRGGGGGAVFTQTSLMCIAASIAFVVCVTPSIVLTMGRHRWKFDGGLTQTAYFASRAVVHQLSCLNHAVNFFLYCVTGQRFRSELVSLLRGQRSSVSAFEASTRRYYVEQAARRSTQTSTSALAMHTVSLTVPTAIDDDDEPDNYDNI